MHGFQKELERSLSHVMAAATTVLAAVLTVLLLTGRIDGAGAILSIVLSVMCAVCAILLAAQHTRLRELEGQRVGQSVLDDFSRTVQSEGKRRRRLTNEDLAFQILKTQAELQSLQQQISPHFLYNTLETIRAQALSEDAEDVATMIELLARLFRYNISRSSEFATIRDEVENVSNYIRIQNYRFHNKFTFIKDLDEIEDLMDRYYLPILSLQPIVENALHHGLEKRVGTGEITIRAFKTDTHLILRIEDNGVGIDNEGLQKIRERLHHHPNAAKRDLNELGKNGIALVNVHQRIQLFFGDRYGLSLSSVPNSGTQVEYALPLEPRLPPDREKQANEA